MSSDKLGSVHRPVVLLDFDLRENGERKRETLELSKEELSKLITSLEAANKVYDMATILMSNLFCFIFHVQVVAQLRT